ncbi:MAG: hypothetical protein Q9191_004240 [Dirinaria sp. TL-2023a]
MLTSSFSSFKKKPYSAITVQVDRLTDEQYDADDMSGIPDLIEVIRLQAEGPVEAARAIRKKLKYGNVHKQLRALTVLDGLIENAGPRFQRAFADEPLLERLRVAATDSLSDPEVKRRCYILFRQWAATYQSTPGMERIVALHKQLPQRKKPVRQDQSKVIRETEREAQEDPFSNNDYRDPVASSSHSQLSSPTTTTALGRPGLTSFRSDTSRKKKSKHKPFNLEKEKPQLLQAIASSSVASTNLMNALKLMDRENKRVSEDAEAVTRFENCKLLRRQILRYIQFVESEQWLGSLIHANDELVNALMAFEVLDKSVENDSDSDEWDSDGSGVATGESPSISSARQGFAGLSFPKPGIPNVALNGKQKTLESDEDDSAEEADDDDPFADRNAVHTPKTERPGMTWKTI